MKYTKAVIVLFFSVLAQVSFLRLITIIPALPDVPLVILFVLSYRLSRFGVLVLTALTGVLIDLFSAAHFGSSSFAAVAAFSACYFFRDNFLKGKSFNNIVLSSVAVFICFYSFLFFINWVLNFSGGNNFAFNLFDKKMAAEFLLTALCAAACAYFLESEKSYVNIRDYKELFKISA